MPGKHVHFASNVFPPTPSPTYSSSSLPSTSGPITPPPVNHFGSPYSYTPLPLVSVHINPVLGLSTTPHLSYNVSQRTSTIVPSHRSVPPSVLAEPATNPPLPSINIISPYLPWTITITSLSGKPGAYVTVTDVLEGLYRALRLNVTPAEFKNLPSYEAQHRVNEAYKHRCMRIPDARAHEEEKAKGVKRIDFLVEKNRFMGLSSTTSGPHIWQLNVA